MCQHNIHGSMDISMDIHIHDKPGDLVNFQITCKGKGKVQYLL